MPVCVFLSQNIGGGWIEAQNSRGDVGLVPEDYIEVGLKDIDT